MKKLILNLLILTFTFGLASCGDVKEKIYINGNVEETIEVNTEFTDKGIVYPEIYTLWKSGSVDSTKLGNYQIVYYVYSPDGELVKELNRFISVVDTTAPTYTEKQNIELYAGFNYNAYDFIDYSDNYDSNITISPMNICFNEKGQKQINIELKDSSGNTSSYSKTVEVKFDFVKLLEKTYKDYPSKIYRNEDIQYTSVSFATGKSIAYFGNTESIHYLENVTTSLGKSASIQISAKYGEFNNANVSFHISGTTSSTYSVGDARIDATIKNGTITHYMLMINNLNLESSTVLEELTTKLPSVVSNFQDYMIETLHIAVK